MSASVQSTIVVVVLGGWVSFAPQALATNPPSLVLPSVPEVLSHYDDPDPVVTFTVSATDIEDGPLIPTVAPPSGSAFPLGDTSVNVSVTDGDLNTVTGSFAVRVRDPFTKPITITQPNDSVSGEVLTLQINVPETPGGSVSIVYNGSPGGNPPSDAFVPVKGNNTVELNVPQGLNDGPVQIELSYQDASAQNDEAVSTANFILDRTPPQIDTSIAYVPPNREGLSRVPNLESRVEDLGSGIANIFQEPSAGGSLSPGSTTLVTVTAEDMVGNLSEVDITVIASSEPPLATESSVVLRQGDTVESSLYPSSSAPPAGSVFLSFGSPAISEGAGLASGATILAEGKKLAAVFGSSGTGGALPGFQGGDAPGILGAKFLSFGDPVISRNGTMAFTAKVSGGGVTALTDEGVWITRYLGVNILQFVELGLREGSVVSGLPSGVRLKAVLGLSAVPGGFMALLSLTGSNVTPANDRALLSFRNDNLGVSLPTGTLLLRTGSPILVSGLPVAVKRFSLFAPAGNATGHGRWSSGEKAVATVTLDDGRTIVASVAPSGLVVRATPSSPSGLAEFSIIAKNGLPAMSPSGQCFAAAGMLHKFLGVTASNDGVMTYATGDQPLACVLREGSLAGNTGVRWATFADPVVSDQGEIAFMATLAGAGVTAANKTSLWSGPPSAPLLVARLGTATVPDASGAIVAGRFWSGITSLALPGGVTRGPLFVATVRGAGVTAATNRRLYCVDTTGRLRELMKPGDTVGAKTIKSFSLLDAVPGSLGVKRSYTSVGSLVISVKSTDNTVSLVRVDLP